MDINKTRKPQQNGEEDPIVVAQRFLNIYRQIHIFNAEKKQAFNQMLLELSPQIRGMFGQLPGGALLQDYVDELAEQAGVEKSIQANDVEIASEDVKQAKILATALAEAQVQATTKMQEMGVAPIAPMQPAQVSPPTQISSAPTKISLDKDFAQELAAAMGTIIQQNTQNQNIEIRNIVSSLGKVQTETIQAIQQENSAQRQDFKQIAQLIAASQLQTKNKPAQTIGPETKHLIEVLLANQRQISERMAKIELKTISSPESIKEQMTMLWQRSEQNMGKMVAFLSERQKKDAMTVAKMISESQQNMWKMVAQNNNLNQNSGNATANNNIQINSSDYSAVLNSIAEKLGALNTAPQKIEVNFPEKALNDMVQVQSALYRQVASEQTKELAKLILGMPTDRLNNNINVPTGESSDQIIFNEQIQENKADDSQVDTSFTETETNIELQESTEFVENAPKKKKKKKKKKKNIITNPLFAPPVIDNDDETETENDNDDIVIDTSETSIDDFSEQEQTDTEKFNGFEDFDETENILSDLDTSFDITSEIENKWETEELKNDDVVESDTKYNLSEILDLNFEPEINNDNEELDSLEKIASEWGFGEEDNENETNSNLDNYNNIQTEEISQLAEDENSDWIWEYVEDNTESQDNEEISYIGENSYIQKGDLYFQQNVYMPKKLSFSDFMGIERTPQIILSTDDENGEDPYKNGVIKN